MTPKTFNTLCRRLATVLVLAVALAVVPGCGNPLKYVKNIFGFGDDPLPSLSGDEAASLAMRAQERMDADDYTEAAELYQQLKDQYPYSKDFALLAELRLGDAYFLDGKYIEAAGAYKNFEDMHPTSDAIPYALYQQGMCHYNMMMGVDRDQTPSVMAIRQFANLVETYPDSKYAAMGKARIAEAQNNLAGHEFYVGEFYYKRKDYQAAMNRFMGLITLYPDSGYHQRAFNYIAEYRDLVATGEIEEGNQRPSEYNSPFTITDVNDTRY
ncbi:MAG: outer membrane protein assembly factor BamD [Deltaproteobacteria bacterium]|jgi:outer membrane protein assembly factor BamD|nr:outer membrane protein assembly factor BamD [Deltaproteobacteria bacterium]